MEVEDKVLHTPFGGKELKDMTREELMVAVYRCGQVIGELEEQARQLVRFKGRTLTASFGQ